MKKKAEALLLGGIKEEVETKIRELHKLREAQDRTISSVGIDAAIPRISGLITDQIIKGNEVKLLASGVAEEEEITDEADDLNKETQQVRKLRKRLSSSDAKLLTTKYKLPDDDVN